MTASTQIAMVGGLIIIVGLVLFTLKGKEEDIIYIDCDSFQSQQEAQDYFLENNATQLDADKDGQACEDLDKSPTYLPLKDTNQNTPVPISSTPENGQVIEVVGEGKVIIEAKPTPTNSPNETPSSTPTEKPQEPTPSPTATEFPSPTPTSPILPSVVPCEIKILNFNINC